MLENPEERPAVEQDVTQGSAAEGRQERDDVDADDVHVLALGFPETGKGAGEHRHDFDDEQQGL